MSGQYVLELVAKFRETESVTNKKRQIKSPVKNVATKVAMLGHVKLDHKLSTRKLATVFVVSRLSHNKKPQNLSS